MRMFITEEDMNGQHADNCEKTRNHYREIYKHFDEAYTGETLISFKTIAGCWLRLTNYYKKLIDEGKSLNKNPKERYDEVLESFNDKYEDSIIDKQLYIDAFKRFYNNYHSFGNFIPLVSDNEVRNKQQYIKDAELKGKKHWRFKVKTSDESNLNLYKNEKYSDYPDRFLLDVQRMFYSENDNPPISEDYVFYSQDNINFFKQFGTGTVGWKKFIKKNYLEAFFDEDDIEYNLPKKLYNEKLAYNGIGLEIHLSRKDNERKEILGFLNLASEIIEAREKDMGY